jgi:hypothetical protein
LGGTAGALAVVAGACVLASVAAFVAVGVVGTFRIRPGGPPLLLLLLLLTLRGVVIAVAGVDATAEGAARAVVDAMTVLLRSEMEMSSPPSPPDGGGCAAVCGGGGPIAALNVGSVVGSGACGRRRGGGCASAEPKDADVRCCCSDAAAARDRFGAPLFLLTKLPGSDLGALLLPPLVLVLVATLLGKGVGLACDKTEEEAAAAAAAAAAGPSPP